MTRRLRSLAELPEHPEPSAVAIGKFDGIHLGHAQVIGRLLRVAADRGLASIVFTFAENPLTLLRPEACPLPLMGAEQRLDALAELGPDTVVMVPFDRPFSELSPTEYAERVLVAGLNARHVIVGEDFRFGHRAAGDVATLRELGERLGFAVETIADVHGPGADRISSTRVREAILAGDVARAAEMLGRPTLVSGEVVHGAARGRELGFPTANLGGEMAGLVPADGVYAGWAEVRGGRFPTAVSVGTNPTFTPDGQATVEAFLLDEDLDLYGEQLRVSFVRRLRGMVAYTTAAALVEQMHADVAETRSVLGIPPAPEPLGSAD